MREGSIYILANTDMPGLVNVGCTTIDPEQRARKMSTTGVPGAFRVIYSLKIDEQAQWKKRVHQALAEYHHGKDWFRCDEDVAIATLKAVVGESTVRELEKESRLSEEEAYEAKLRRDYEVICQLHPARCWAFRRWLKGCIRAYYKRQFEKYSNDASIIAFFFLDGGWSNEMLKEERAVLESMDKVAFKDPFGSEELFVQDMKRRGRKKAYWFMLNERRALKPSPRGREESPDSNSDLFARGCIEVNRTMHPVLQSILENVAKRVAWLDWIVTHSPPVLTAKARRRSTWIM